MDGSTFQASAQMVGPSSFPAVDHAGAQIVTKLADYGGMVIVLIIALAVSVFFNFYLLKRNGAIVDLAMNIIPTATATVATAVNGFTEKVDVLIKLVKKD